VTHPYRHLTLIMFVLSCFPGIIELIDLKVGSLIGLGGGLEGWGLSTSEGEGKFIKGVIFFCEIF